MKNIGTIRWLTTILVLFAICFCLSFHIVLADTVESGVGVPGTGSEEKKNEKATKSVNVDCDTVESLVGNYLEKLGTGDAIEEDEITEKLKSCPMESLGQLGKVLAGVLDDDIEENDKQAIPAAKLLNKLAETADEEKLLDANVRENFSTFEALKKNLIRAYRQDDPKLKDPVHKAWLILFPGSNIYEQAQEKISDPGYKTSHFFLHTGAVLLNPYTLEKDSLGEGYELQGSGDTDTSYFIEALYRNRYAWHNREPKKWLLALDYEMRLGIAGSDSDPSGAVVSGAGDAYMEFSFGKPIFGKDSLKKSLTDEVRWTCNLEGLAGFVTDKGAQDIHFYWGIGPVVAVGIQLNSDKDNNETNENHRKIEVIGGFYAGKTDMPQFIDENSSAVKTKNSYPLFKPETAFIWRGDIHFPIQKNGFITITGRFTQNWEKESINPWNIAIGYTVPFEVISDSLSKLFNQ